ncbi:acyltransferase [Flavihumibacter sp. CACIAM 22H1]|uniref:acyltransferase family protein n=1 Tax=Flavihumibacter sp. CACIAM 22H1 TaxID=1812911 RepID=UPI0007A92799|nr:acyltransferase [Flavihumibacter sp. CACIAM 22H1]KYP15986.1 MAG: hypothetical protein A1D16_06920 [Flavihumibacter sp. CACIAM 22H1]
MNDNRIVYIDNIKVFLTGLVVAHHSAQAYGPTGGIWVVNDPFKADWLKNFFFINASYMMGLYFFISGYFMVFSIKKKSNAVFLNERFKRLGVPLLFFTLFIFLPFNYYNAESNNNILSFFIDSYLHKPPVATGHLWFVALLLVFSIIYIIFFHKRFISIAEKTGPLPVRYILVFTVALTLLCAAIRFKYPIDVWRTWLIPVEPAHLPQYFLLFLAGTFFNHANWLNQLAGKQSLSFFGFAVFIYLTQRYLPYKITNYLITESLVESVMCIGISMGILSFFKSVGNKTNTLISKISANAYGIYLLHLFIVIFLQYGLINLSINANIKFISVTIAGILLSVLLSITIRHNKYIRQII